MRALLHAYNLLGLVTGRHLRDARALDDPLRHLHARLEEAELKARLAWECVGLLQARLAKIPERKRPHYTPTQRFQILALRKLMNWSRDQTAAIFLVCVNTISNWDQHANAGTETVGSTVKPTPPVMRFADVTRFMVQTMKRLGFGSDDLVAKTLTRAGWRLAARSVGRITREAAQPDPSEPDSSTAPDKRGNPVNAKFVHHTWMMDVSEVKAFLGGPFYMAAVFDACSRFPLRFQTFDHKPGAADMARLFKAAARAFALPKYMITDLGGEFTGHAFKNTVKRLGVQQRFGHKDNLYATARLESFWRTLKNVARLRLPTFLTLADLEQRLAPALAHYALFRPHQALHGATPAEILLGVEPAHTKAVRAPRGRPGEPTRVPPFRLAMLAPREKLFPILLPAAA